MSESELKQLESELNWNLGSDVYSELMAADIAEIYQQAAEEVGLPCRSYPGKEGEPYVFSGSTRLHRGVFEEGDVIVKINYEGSPEKMSQLHRRVGEIKQERSTES